MWFNKTAFVTLGTTELMTHYGASNVPESLDSYHKQICFRLLVLNRIPPHRAASDGLGAPAWWPTVVLPHRAASDGLGAPGGRQLQDCIRSINTKPKQLLSATTLIPRLKTAFIREYWNTAIDWWTDQSSDQNSNDKARQRANCCYSVKHVRRESL